jgi:peptide/nickel transport system permease protein
VAASLVVASAFALRPPMVTVLAALVAVVVATLPPRAGRQLARRLPGAVGVVVVVTFLVFVTVDVLPDNTRTTFGTIDGRLVTDYLRWLGAAAGGDLGISRGIGEPVTTALARTIPVTLLLIAYSQALAFAAAVPLALWGGAREGSLFDRLTTTTMTGLVSVPVFVSAVVLQIVFVIGPVHIGPIPLGGSWLPAARYVTFGDGAWQHARSMLLPTLTLTLSVLPTYARTLRADVVSTTREDFVAAVRARGLPRRAVLVRHVLKPSTVSVISLVAANTGVLIGYVFIIDEMFSRPGLGDYLQTAVARRDQPAIVGVVGAVTLVVVVTNLVADAVQLALDPRIEMPRRPRRPGATAARWLRSPRPDQDTGLR